MIKINVSDSTREKIEVAHWKWFQAYYKDKILTEDLEGDEKIYYKEYNKDTKEYQLTEIDDDEIKRLIKYITQPEIIETLIIGKWTNEENKSKSLKIITEYILKEFPLLFHESINKSVKSFVHKKREILATHKDCNEDGKLDKVKEVKKNLKNFFESNKEILQIYIDNYDNIYSEIDTIYLAKCNVMKFNEDKFLGFKYNNRGQFDKVKEILSVIFNYDYFASKKKDIEIKEISENAGRVIEDINWNAYDLLAILNITTCPYCNRSYIHTYVGNYASSRADIDHFYPKSIYPFLAVSLYNFIPSCHMCNASFKSSLDTFLIPHIYPHEEEFGQSVRFRTEPCGNTDPLKYMQGNSLDFDILLDINDKTIEEKVGNSNSTFAIEGIYEFHKDYVQEIIKKAIVYNESRINELEREYPGLFENKEELIRVIFANYINAKDLGKRPLSKLTKDICEEFGIVI
ncbi:hypothetical protein LGL55_20520 [Clostridium tagluense]|uniref:hypothetical protein n=1 Tax=Clostridium tagluense TaxID=360422 RepID=UPI001CF1064F|nr:hypothetical protein [Clostridium tagluense]MCB2313467.1 hypothetical protein [Clostridium tagluense]MCB2318266.1 hypothetical protein [Clostridium tagluense]MCB2323068.1 hypothetical protein [Clostridium tagluense]MCB2328050.1 hypothetical protein [Clostridium tagluense]MCB2332794.1 hypothetical protein [Clostridium tagluense]